MTLPPQHSVYPLQKCICTGRFQPGKARITAKNARTSPNCVNCNLIITLDDDQAKVLVDRLLIALMSRLMLQMLTKQDKLISIYGIN